MLSQKPICVARPIGGKRKTPSARRRTSSDVRERERERERRERERERERVMATTAAMNFDPGHRDVVHDVQFDYYGKRVATASSDRTVQMRDILFSLGDDKPSWDTQKIKGVLIAIVRSLTTNNLRDMLSLETNLGIKLPKAGYQFQPRSVPQNQIKIRDTQAEKKRSQSYKKRDLKRQCVSCGEFARSVCFYKCCKKCCAQLKNPCTVHVLTNTKVFGKKGYGDALTCPPVLPSAFVSTPEVAGKAQPRLRDLKENLDAFYEENREVLQWRKEVTRRTERAEEEFAAEALDRYERNASLLAQVMKVENLEKVMLESVDQAEEGLNARKKEALQKELNEEAGPAGPSSTKSPLEMYNSRPTHLNLILKDISQSKTMDDIQRCVKNIESLADTDLETIKKFTEWLDKKETSKFNIISKAEAPKPDLTNFIDIPREKNRA